MLHTIPITVGSKDSEEDYDWNKKVRKWYTDNPASGNTSSMWSRISRLVKILTVHQTCGICDVYETIRP